MGLAAAAAITACGNGPDSGGVVTSTATSSVQGISCAPLEHVTGSVDDHGSAAAQGTTIAVEAGDSFFKPTCTTSVQQGTITVRIHNSRSALHNFSVGDQSIDIDVSPGQTITAQVKVGGTPIAYLCKYHRAAGMQGFLVPAG